MVEKNQTQKESLSSASPGFWLNAWHRYRKDKVSMFGFYILIAMFFVAFFAPLIVGTKPLICKYQGKYYFPFLGYYNEDWENAIFKTRDKFGGLYPGNLQQQPKELLEKAKEKQNRILRKVDRIKQQIAKIEEKRPKSKKSTDMLEDLLLEYPKNLERQETYRNEFFAKEYLQYTKETQQIVDKIDQILSKQDQVPNSKLQAVVLQKMVLDLGQRRQQKKSEAFFSFLNEDSKKLALQFLRERELKTIADRLETPEEQKTFQYLLDKESKEYVDLIWLQKELKQQEELLDTVKDEIRTRQKEQRYTAENWALYPLVFADPFDKIKVEEIQKMVQSGVIDPHSWIALFEPIDVHSPPPSPVPLFLYHGWLSKKVGTQNFQLQLQEKIAILQKEISDLQSKTDEPSKKLTEQKQQELQNDQDELNEVLKKIEKIRAELRPLEEESAPLKKELSDRETEMRGHRDQIRELHISLQTLKKEIQDLEIQEDLDLEEQIQQLKKTFEEKTQQKNETIPTILAEIEKTELAMEELEPKIKGVQSKITILEKEIEILEGKTLKTHRRRLQNLFGTDMYGRDVFARIIHGTRIALLVGFVSMGIATFIGLFLGGIAGFFGGWTDTIISRFIDLIMSIPSLILILAMIAIVEKPTIWDLMVVIGLTSWVSIARLTRGEFLKLKSLDYVMAGHALGYSNFRIMFRHILPNSLAPVIVNVTFGIASAILTESGLSFLGFGAQEPTPSWGNILSNGFKSGLTDYWLIGSASIAIFIAIFTYNIVGDGLQEALDPRLK